MYQRRNESNFVYWWRRHGLTEWIGGAIMGVALAYMCYLGVPTA